MSDIARGGSALSMVYNCTYLRNENLLAFCDLKNEIISINNLNNDQFYHMVGSVLKIPS